MTASVVLSGVAAHAALEDATRDDVLPVAFAPPVQLLAAGEPVQTEQPGYASPAWYDFDGDGKHDLVVGQFAGGKMRVYRSTEDGLGAGEWIQAGGETAEVPGVW
ncbi:MAG: hypothetical protein AAF957_24605 [Planctomycetota bacterium]